MYLASLIDNKYVAEAQSFQYTPGTARTALPISLNEVLQHIRVDDPLEQTDYLNTLIKSAVDQFEYYTNICLIQQTWTTYRDDFFMPAIELRKGLFQSLTSFQYLVNGVLTTVDPTLYYIPPNNEYAQIILKPDKQYPNDIDYLQAAVKIVFVSGFATSDAGIPSDIKTCLYNLVAFLYDNRGNNDVAAMSSKGVTDPMAGLNSLPNHVSDIIMKYRIQDIFGGFFIRY